MKKQQRLSNKLKSIDRRIVNAAVRYISDSRDQNRNNAYNKLSILVDRRLKLSKGLEYTNGQQT